MAIDPCLLELSDTERLVPAIEQHFGRRCFVLRLFERIGENQWLFDGARCVRAPIKGDDVVRAAGDALRAFHAAHAAGWPGVGPAPQGVA